jgi:phosphosulfolactate phosphohydrolase-like enzyme
MTRQEIEAEKLFDATVVVIDVFLATTTLLTILENGARSVLSVASLEEAEEVGETLDRSHASCAAASRTPRRSKATTSVPTPRSTRLRW